MAENGNRGDRGFQSRAEVLLGLPQTAGEQTEETLNELHENDIFWGDKESQQNALESDLFGRMHARKSSWGNVFPHGRQKLGESAPVNVPNYWPRTIKTSHQYSFSDEDDETVMTPPHELVAHYNNNNNNSSYSVVEGYGRTLKGRDLRRVRDAVFRQTGFVD